MARFFFFFFLRGGGGGGGAFSGQHLLGGGAYFDRPHPAASYPLWESKSRYPNLNTKPYGWLSKLWSLFGSLL